MSGYPNPGSGGGSVGTLAQVLAKGADANSVEITNGHDPTAAQSLATKHYVDTSGVGGPPSGAAGGSLGGSYPNPILKKGRYWFDLLDYGAVGDGTTDDYAAIDSARAAANTVGASGPSPIWIPTPPSAYLVKTTLTLDAGLSLLGPGVQGSSPQYNYDGADATNAIAFSGASNSRGRIGGFRLTDTRTSPTSGDGLHIDTTNGSIIENMSVFGFPGSCIYLGATSGTPDNYSVEHVWVGGGGGWGITCDHIAENCLLLDIKGDYAGTGIKGLINLTGAIAGGYTNIVIIGAKTEVAGTPSPAPDLVYIDSTFVGRVTLIGGFLGPHGGYLVNNQSTTSTINVISASTPGPISGLIFTAAAGTLYNRNTTTAISANTTIGNGSTVKFIGNCTFIASGSDAATL